MTCTDIALEQNTNTSKINADNRSIEANRQRNETAGYLGGMLILPLVAIQQNDAERDEIAHLQQRQDVLRDLAVVKHCS